MDGEGRWGRETKPTSTIREGGREVGRRNEGGEKVAEITPVLRRINPVSQSRLHVGRKTTNLTNTNNGRKTKAVKEGCGVRRALFPAATPPHAALTSTAERGWGKSSRENTPMRVETERGGGKRKRPFVPGNRVGIGVP
jgi:hypothetical protein